MNHDNARFYIGSHFDASGRSGLAAPSLGPDLRGTPINLAPAACHAQIRDPPTHRNHEGHAGDGLFPRLTLSAREAELLNAEALF